MNPFKEVISRTLPKGQFVHSVTVLVGGTAFAQVINVAALPVLTRLYSPSEFGVVATYIAVVSIITTIACLRFEIAIPVPKEDEVAVNLVILSLLSVTFFSATIGLVICIFESYFISVMNGRLTDFSWLVPISILAVGFSSVFQYWAARKKQFKIVAKTKVLQSVAGVSTKIFLGCFGGLSLGLLYGQFSQNVSGVAYLGVNVFKNIRSDLINVTYRSLRNTFIQYSRFPKYSVFEAFANIAAIQIPVLLIAHNVSAEAGFLILAMQLLSAPMSLIGSATAQVYLTQASEKMYRGELYDFTIETSRTLAKIGVAPMLIAGAFSPLLIPTLFGELWGETGMIITWMVPWFFLQFVVSPISMSLHIMEKQKTAMLLQVFGSILRIGSVIWAIKFVPDETVYIYALSGFIFYFVYLLVVLSELKKYRSLDMKN